MFSFVLSSSEKRDSKSDRASMSIHVRCKDELLNRFCFAAVQTPLDCGRIELRLVRYQHELLVDHVCASSSI